VENRIDIMIMSGIEDGQLLQFSQENDGVLSNENEQWTLNIGRREENDICLKSDTFVSRTHAKLHWRDAHWWLEDCKSTNGTFVEHSEDFFSDVRVTGIIQIEIDQLFRVGRTWMAYQG
jgi:predicted component of type VI protein secretion system